MKKETKYTRQELLEEMKNIVDKKLKAYKEDFDIDVKQINEFAEKGDDIKFLWIVRRDGTHIILDGEEEYLHGVRINYKDRINYTYIEYEIELKAGQWTLKKIYESKCKEIEYSYGEYRLKVTYKGNDFAQVSMSDVSVLFPLIWSYGTSYKKAKEYIKKFKANGFFDIAMVV